MHIVSLILAAAFCSAANSSSAQDGNEVTLSDAANSTWLPATTDAIKPIDTTNIHIKEVVYTFLYPTQIRGYVALVGLGFTDAYLYFILFQRSFYLSLSNAEQMSNSCVIFSQSATYFSFGPAKNFSLSSYPTSFNYIGSGTVSLSSAKIVFTSSSVTLNTNLAQQIRTLNGSLVAGNTSYAADSILQTLMISSSANMALTSTQFVISSGVLVGNFFNMTSNSISSGTVTFTSGTAFSLTGNAISSFSGGSFSSMIQSISSAYVGNDTFGYPTVCMTVGGTSPLVFNNVNSTFAGNFDMNNGTLVMDGASIRLNNCPADSTPIPAPESSSFSPVIIGTVLGIVPVLIAMFVWRVRVKNFYGYLRFRITGRPNKIEAINSIKGMMRAGAAESKYEGPVPPVNSLSPSAFKHEIYNINEGESMNQNQQGGTRRGENHRMTGIQEDE